MIQRVTNHITHSLTAALLLLLSSGIALADSQAKPQLIEGNWDSFNRTQINRLLQETAQENATKKGNTPYAVFDFDNTTVFLDIGEAVFIYQLENLIFAMTPEQLKQAIYKDIPLTHFSSDYRNAQGKTVSIKEVGADIIASYQWLYQHYQGFKGTKSLDEVKKSSAYQNFTSKMLYLYEAIGGSFDHSVSYPWVTYLFTGMTEQQVRELTEKALLWQQTQSIEKVNWTSSQQQVGQAGVLSVSWKNGMRFVPEMHDLYQKLQQAGIEVYICSASYINVIQGVVNNSKYGFDLPVDHVYAMRLKKDAEGKLMSEMDDNYPQTQGAGKTATIERFLQKKYGHGPILVAGDSEGDQNMLADFQDTRVSLIINRLRSASQPIGQLSKQAVESYGQENARYLLQGRNDNRGEFVPSQQHYPFGKQQGAVLP